MYSAGSFWLSQLHEPTWPAFWTRSCRSGVWCSIGFYPSQLTGGGARQVLSPVVSVILGTLCSKHLLPTLCRSSSRSSRLELEEKTGQGVARKLIGLREDFRVANILSFHDFIHISLLEETRNVPCGNHTTVGLPDRSCHNWWAASRGRLGQRWRSWHHQGGS